MTIEFEYGRPTLKRKDGINVFGRTKIGSFINTEEEMPIKLNAGEQREFKIKSFTEYRDDIMTVKIASDKSDRGGIITIKARSGKEQNIVLGQDQEVVRVYDSYGSDFTMARGFRARHVSE